MKKADNKNIVVTGDVTIDWNIARLPRGGRRQARWTWEEDTAIFCQPGGAAMLAEMISAVAKNLAKSHGINIDIVRPELPSHPISPTDNRFHHSYATWSPFKLNEKRPGAGSVWRIQEFLGLNPMYVYTGRGNKRVARASIVPAIITLDDTNLGFRDHPELWPSAISTSGHQPWILVNQGKPVAAGKLWENLYKNHADKLIVVMTAGDLRGSQVQISHQLSWERTSQELVWELLHNPQVNTLSQCAHVIVTFNGAGAVLISQTAGPVPDAKLFFDPVAMEDEWGSNHEGYMVGYNSCLVAAIVRELILNAKKPDIPRGIQNGVHAMRLLHIEGYGKFTDDPKQIKLALPAVGIAESLAEEGKYLAEAPIKNPDQAGENDFWTILGDKNPDSLERVAERIVREGLESAFNEVPIGTFGDLKTVDRKEIESLHSISTLIHDYALGSVKKPLSIAVFGPPGSGKSFSVEEVAKTIMPETIKKLSFNLSQFTSLGDLYDAFHQVRDVCLTGKMPLVFWDEFDTRFQNEPLGWLRYFLAPMQDGQFQEGQINHPIGRCIFVFAGGTSHTIGAFTAHLDEQKAAKLPDFVSRLKSFLNILGPNPQAEPKSKGRYADPYHVIRRAIILRSNLERSYPQLLREGKQKVAEIDEGVLRAFLLAKEYRHGARSMEAIMAMSQLSGKTCFERSCLPTVTQLDLHVNGLDFSAIVNKIEMDNATVEKLAEACHEVFCDSLRAKHYKYGKVTNQKKRVHSSLMPYARLPEDEKEQNRSNVRDIPDKLARVSYVIVPARGHARADEFTPEEIEKLAKQEHERWMQQKYLAGWKYAGRTDKPRKLHKGLVDWDVLPETEKEKDRVLVTGIPKILYKAGYIMVKLNTEPHQNNIK